MVRDYSENFCIRGHLLRSQYGFFLGKQTIVPCDVLTSARNGMSGQAYAKVGTGEGVLVDAGSGVAAMAHGSWTMGFCLTFWTLCHGRLMNVNECHAVRRGLDYQRFDFPGPASWCEPACQAETVPERSTPTYKTTSNPRIPSSEFQLRPRPKMVT